MGKINIVIDNVNIETEPNKTILEVAKENGINIPTLCFLKGVNEPASCRVCVVEVEGARGLVTSCNTMVRDGMVVKTCSERVLNARKTTVELLLSNHRKDCLSCEKNLKCTLQKLSEEFRCDENKFEGVKSESKMDLSSPSIYRDESKCVLCGRCISVCKKVQSVNAINKIGRGFSTKVGCVFDEGFDDSACIGCGQCVLVCPTGALCEKSDINKVLGFLSDATTKTVIQIAPSVRVAIAEEFGAKIGEFSEAKLASALHRLGFDYVYDVNVGADFTIVEESKELINRINNNGVLPMFTSCCPGWYKFVEKEYPEFLPNVSTCKSPNEMLASLVRFKAQTDKVDNIKIVSVMPCTAKKHEILRNNNIDANLTTRELAKLIKYKNIDFNSLSDGKFDEPFGIYSGAALIFGASGGVMEAAVRTAQSVLNKGENKNLDIETIRHSDGRKLVEIKTDVCTLRLAIINGISNARDLLEEIKSGKTKVDFVEIMACPGGCINGGGQPFVDYNKNPLNSVIAKRSEALYKQDGKLNLRESHKNENVLNVYKNLLKNDEKLIHSLLHNSSKK